MKTLQEIRQHFQQDQFASQLGIKILYCNDEKTLCQVPIAELQKNALGRAQGGLLFTLADFTFAVAANVHCLGTVTVNSSIHFLAAPQGNILQSEARPKRLGKRLCVYEVELFDETDTIVALATFTGCLPPNKQG